MDGGRPLTAEITVEATPPFEDAYRRHAAAVHRYCLSQCWDRGVAEDLTHETFARALGVYQRAAPAGDSIRSWLLAIAHNVCVDHGRREHPRRRLLRRVHHQPAAVADVELRPRFAGASPYGPVQGSSSMWAGGLTIISQSMATGAVQGWLASGQIGLPLNNQQGPLVQVVATTARGDPIIQVGGSDLTHLQPNQQTGVTQETLLLTAHATVLNQGAVGGPNVAANLSPLSVTAGGTVWMADDQGGIWTYTKSRGMREAARIRTTNDGAPGVAISGPCE